MHLWLGLLTWDGEATRVDYGLPWTWSHDMSGVSRVKSMELQTVLICLGILFHDNPYPFLTEFFGPEVTELCGSEEVIQELTVYFIGAVDTETNTIAVRVLPRFFILIIVFIVEV